MAIGGISNANNTLALALARYPPGSILALAFSLSVHIEMERQQVPLFLFVLASDADAQPHPLHPVPPFNLANSCSFFQTQLKYFLRRPWKCAHFHVPSAQHRAWHAGIILPAGLAHEAIFLPDHTTALGEVDP